MNDKTVVLKNGSVIKTIESKEFMKGKRLTSRESRLMLHLEMERTEDSVLELCKTINPFSLKDKEEQMITLEAMGITEEDFHTKWYLTGRKNQLLRELAECVGDVETLKIARKLKHVVKELKELK